MTQQADAGFQPSRHGFAFGNDWPGAAAVAIPTPLGTVRIGNAARGLCGGMIFAALDYWRAGTVPPADRPSPRSDLYRYIVRRLVTSWRLPTGVARYYRWMIRSDRDVARRTVTVQWPQVRTRLAAGEPVPLGLVTVASANPALLPRNHQVLACAYQIVDGVVTLGVYDPNSGPSDEALIRFDTTAPDRATFAHSLNIGWPVRGFFRTAYSAAVPPGPATGPAAGLSPG